MERLTEWVGSGPDRKAIARQDCGDIGDKDCVARLAAYEDTNLTPEAAAQLKQIAEIFNCDPNDPAQLKQLCDKLRGWQQAEQAGRLVVLPVEPWLGPTQQNEMYIRENGEVWAIYVTGCEAGPNADGVFTVMYTTLDGDVFSADDIGKTVFLTRQEAEAAVESAKTTKEEI